MRPPIDVSPSPARRRLILAGALLLALVVWLPHKTRPAGAQETKAVPTASSPSATVAVIPADTKPAGEDTKPAGEKSVGKGPRQDAGQAETRKDAAAPADGQAAPESSRTHTITISNGAKTITMTGAPKDDELESVGHFAHTEPVLAAMIAAIVAVIFLSPVLAIALILVYRMRKARMLNETMLKLAEKGLVPPAEAIEAVAGNYSPAASAVGLSAPPGPIYDNAIAIRKRATWSDLRKGIIMGAIGLGLTSYSIFDDGTPNGIGLILLFVGVGYVGLWWFEQRAFSPANGNRAGDSGHGPTNR